VRRRHIAGEFNAGLVRSTNGRAGAGCDYHHFYGLVVMIIGDNNGLLQGPADPKRIDVHSPAEMRHWVREFSRPAAKLNEAVETVGPLVSDVRDYLQKHSLYGKFR